MIEVEMEVDTVTDIGTPMDVEYRRLVHEAKRKDHGRWRWRWRWRRYIPVWRKSVMVHPLDL
jgi:hypothetical protein